MSSSNLIIRLGWHHYSLKLLEPLPHFLHHVWVFVRNVVGLTGVLFQVVQPHFGSVSVGDEISKPSTQPDGTFQLPPEISRLIVFYLYLRFISVRVIPIILTWIPHNDLVVSESVGLVAKVQLMEHLFAGRRTVL